MGFDRNLSYSLAPFGKAVPFLLCYVLALGTFIRKTNPVLRVISLPGATTSPRSSGSADDDSFVVSSRAVIDEIDKYVRGGETVTGAKNNQFVCVGLAHGREFLFPCLSSCLLFWSRYTLENELVGGPGEGNYLHFV